MMNFNPRSPQGGATLIVLPLGSCVQYFNPRSPQGGATNEPFGVPKMEKISIHAPRKGERRICARTQICNFRISIHAPRKGERRSKKKRKDSKVDFNPRSPQGGATYLLHYSINICINFNPRSPQGGATVSIKFFPPVQRFQSTLPARGSDA